MAKTPQHFDKLGVEILVDLCVAYPDSNSLMIGRVTKLNNKMVKIEPLGVLNKGHQYRSSREVNKYPSDCVVIDSPDVTMWLLKKEN